MRIHYFQHGPGEGPGEIENWAVRKGHTVTGTNLYLNEPVPAPHEIDWLLVLGGAMNVYEYRNHPWLLPEKRYIGEFLGLGKPIIGVCLGAQLIADVLGAKVFQCREVEFGWHPVRMLPAAKHTPLFAGFPDVITPLHWHGDTFELPHGAVRVASTDPCPNQAFVVGNKVVGLQFHIEVAQPNVEEFLRDVERPPGTGMYIQSIPEVRAGVAGLASIHAPLYSLLDALAAE